MDKTDKACPVSDFTSMLGGKWKLVIIGRLRNKEALRFGFLAASIDNISRKVLADQLKELAKDGLVERMQYNEIPPRVEYFSIIAVLKPNWAQRIAETYPPGPEPIMVTSN